MPFVEQGAIRYLTFDLLSENNVDQAVFTRHGGVSPAPWFSLNQGGTVGDIREHVIENRLRCFSVFNRPVESIFDVWQVHGTKVLCTDHPRPLSSPHTEADGIATDRPGVTLFMRFADCVPLLFHDPVKGVVGIAHAGWKGTVNKIGAMMIQTLLEKYGCRPEDVLVGIGPSISMERYPVGPDVTEQVHDRFGADSKDLLHRLDGRVHLDLWKANRFALLHAGVREDHIECSELCTAQNTQDWFSHRAEHGKTGRFGVLLALK
jgi:polyphenol oxidase